MNNIIRYTKHEKELKQYAFKSKPDKFDNIMFKFNGKYERPAVIIAGLITYLHEGLQIKYPNHNINSAIWAYPIRYHNRQRKALLDASM